MIKNKQGLKQKARANVPSQQDAERSIYIQEVWVDKDRELITGESEVCESCYSAGTSKG